MTTITALPTPPSRDDPANFASRGDALLGALPTFVTQVNTVAGEVNTNAGTASTAASTATTQAGIATTQAGIATTKAGLTAADAIATAADRVQTGLDRIAAAGSASAASDDAGAVAGMLASIAGGPVASVNGKTGVAVIAPADMTMNTARILGRTAAGAGAVGEISVSGATLSGGVLTIASGAASITRSARPSNTILGAADKGVLIDITSGTFTQTFTAAATLADGWWCYIRNSGTGDVTLDPNASEQIDGLTSYIMYPGETRLVQCTGTAFFTMVLSGFYREFLATGTFTKPPGYRMFQGLLWSGGASGMKGGASARGGGGGGCFPFALPEAVISATETITIGAGGLATTTGTRNAGGNSSIGSLLVVYGADASGVGGAVKSPRGAAALTTSRTDPCGFESTSDMTGSRASVYGGGNGHNDSAEGGAAIYGGGAGGGYNAAARAGGASTFGGAGGACGDSVNGTSGTVPGGGGGGTNTGTQSGAGGAGACRIWGVI
jgi:hypothetical protein